MPFTHEETNELRLMLLRIVRSIRANYVGSVSPSQIGVLVVLVTHGPSTIGQIAEYERVQPPSASRTVAALEKAGLVERTPDAQDRRSVRISLSPLGEQYLEEMKQVGTSWLTGRLGGLDDADRDAIRAALPALARLVADDV
ncbi:MAG: MarR family transcriptional regulator [Ilumatobacteraceae bacterium]